MYEISPLREQLNRALDRVVALERGVALCVSPISDPLQRKELLAAKEALINALDLEGKQ